MTYDPRASIPCTADLSARAPAFVQAPRLVFAAPGAAPSRSELLRQQIAAARERARTH
ncbi:hypothetical protein [Sphingomonas sp. BK235]|jgi:hypothetical protein|uniref:hypothetical protein n=1 Tax=Sphingomonas sp. BK235 TaxID=2512131 RepID=UPI0010F33CAC|nr:hypothetical protein [Sphingomonas sp. BK235]TCP35131.1 hypothetical protein EV292_103563 [Sphingomonas sp. BK235]